MVELSPKVAFEMSLIEAATREVQDRLDQQGDDGWVWLTAEEVADQIGERYDEMDVVRSPNGNFYSVEVDVSLNRLEARTDD